MDPIRLLLLEDSPEDAELVLQALRQGGLHPEARVVDSEAPFREALKSGDWDLVISDYSLPGYSGLDALVAVKAAGVDMPFILVSGTVGEEVAVAAMKAGAQDYVLKANLSRLAPAVERELREHALRKAHRRTCQDLLLSEERFRQAQKMEAVGRLAGGISHDFNNLLMVINSYCDLVLAEAGPAHSWKADLEEVRRAGEKAAGLTRQLLAFSRKETVEPQRLDLNALAVEMARMLRRVLGAGIELSVRTAPDLGPILADPNQIQQVILNLVLNARDAMPQGGRVMLATSRLLLEQARAEPPFQPGDYRVLEVADTGTGMDAETLQHIFEPFFTTKGEGKGTGLGLATVYGVVTQSRGHIAVSSRVGEGTRFEVFFPAAPDGPAAAAAAEVAVPWKKASEVLLLVEDDDANRHLIARVLGSQGYGVRACSGAEEALRLVRLETGPIHLMLSDVMLRGMDGVRLAQAMGEARPGIKALLMSGYPDEAASAGGTAFLQKPFTPDQLLRKVRQVLDSA